MKTSRLLFVVFALLLAWCGRDGTRLMADDLPDEETMRRYTEACAACLDDAIVSCQPVWSPLRPTCTAYLMARCLFLPYCLTQPPAPAEETAAIRKRPLKLGVDHHAPAVHRS